MEVVLGVTGWVQILHRCNHHCGAPSRSCVTGGRDRAWFWACPALFLPAVCTSPTAATGRPSGVARLGASTWRTEGDLPPPEQEISPPHPESHVWLLPRNLTLAPNPEHTLSSLQVPLKTVMPKRWLKQLLWSGRQCNDTSRHMFGCPVSCRRAPSKAFSREGRVFQLDHPSGVPERPLGVPGGGAARQRMERSPLLPCWWQCR